MKQESQDSNPGLSDSRDGSFSWIHKAVWLIYLKEYLNRRVLQLLSLRLNIKVSKYGKPTLFIPVYSFSNGLSEFPDLLMNVFSRLYLKFLF